MRVSKMTDLSHLPLSQFDNRFRLLLQKGCTEYVEVPCRDGKAALHLRNTLTTYRAKLRKENRIRPEVWEPLYGTIISIKRQDRSIVTLRPRQEEFSDALDKLGIERPDPNLTADPLLEMLKEKYGEEETEK